MSDNIALKVLSFHLPLLRGPLLLNNLIAIVLCGFSTDCTIYIAELVILTLSSLRAFSDFGAYLNRCDVTRHVPIEEQDILVEKSVVLGDAAATISLLVIWILGVLVSGRNGPSQIATVCAFLAWLSHTTSLTAELYLMMCARSSSLVCPHCHQVLEVLHSKIDMEARNRPSEDTLYNEDEHNEDAYLLGENDEAKIICCEEHAE